MKDFSKRFISILMAIVTCLCFTLSVSANEFENALSSSEATSPRHITYEVTSEGIISAEVDGQVMPRSSISGYANGNCDGPSCIFICPVISSGEGGMGITVKASSSWDGYMSMDITSGGFQYYVKDYAMPSNGERQFHDLYHEAPTQVALLLMGIPVNEYVHIDMWVYG